MVTVSSWLNADPQRHPRSIPPKARRRPPSQASTARSVPARQAWSNQWSSPIAGPGYGRTVRFLGATGSSGAGKCAIRLAGSATSPIARGFEPSGSTGVSTGAYPGWGHDALCGGRTKRPRHQEDDMVTTLDERGAHMAAVRPSSEVATRERGHALRPHRRRRTARGGGRGPSVSWSSDCARAGARQAWPRRLPPTRVRERAGQFPPLFVGIDGLDIRCGNGDFTCADAPAS